MAFSWEFRGQLNICCDHPVAPPKPHSDAGRRERQRGKARCCRGTTPPINAFKYAAAAIAAAVAPANPAPPLAPPPPAAPPALHAPPRQLAAADGGGRQVPHPARQGAGCATARCPAQEVQRRRCSRGCLGGRRSCCCPAAAVAVAAPAPHCAGPTSTARPSRAAPHAHKPRTPPTALRLEPRRAALDGRAAAPLRVAAEFPPTQTRFLHGRGTWVLALRCRYLAQSLSCGIQIHVLQHWLHTTLVVATIFYSTRHWYNVSRIVLCDR